MIVEAFLDFLFGIANLVLGFIPGGGAPGWLTNASGYFSSIWAGAAGLGAWIPWTVVGSVLVAVMAGVAIGLGLRLVRMVVSLSTGGGGSAG